MGTAAPDLVRSGWDALADADWEKARSCFEDAAKLGETAEVLDGLGQVVNFQGEYELAIALKEKAFAAYRQEGKPAEAANVARSLAFLHATFAGNFTVASAWIARAESALEGVEECSAHGWLILDRAPFSRDSSERERFAASALAIARRFGDADLEFDALALLGETYVASGRTEEGMKLVDQAMAAIAGGEVRAHDAIGEIYCRLLSACEHAMDIRRAEEWMSVIDRFVAWDRFVQPTCRTHYGGILVALGRWSEAESELLDAIQTFERGYRGDRAFPLVRLAELRVRQGRLEEAERLLDGVEWHPVARRSAARIALERGELPLASELAGVCFEGQNESDPACAPLFELLVRIQLARDDVAGARGTLDRLLALAGETRNERASAFAELSAGEVCSAAGDGRAVTHLKQAVEMFSSLDSPVEAAQSQLELARALAPGASEAAAVEARLALETFERIGATRDADAAAGLLRRLGATGRAWPKRFGTLTKRETEVMSLLGDGLSNADIAGRLYISRRTAEHHVASILSKLGLRSRAEAAAYAVRERAKDR